MCRRYTQLNQRYLLARHLRKDRSFVSSAGARQPRTRQLGLVEGILVLSHPSDREKIIRLELLDAFELPPEATLEYPAMSPWKEAAGRPAIVLRARQEHEFHLAPFEALTLDILPNETAHV
jgi:hypothetical protein